jgi:hypothetical protein
VQRSGYEVLTKIKNKILKMIILIK